MKFLSISPVMPYDGIGHAGGKTFNYYLKKISSNVDVSALIFSKQSEKEKCDLNDYQIEYNLIITSGRLIVNISHFLFDIIGYCFYCNKMYSFFKYKKIVEFLDALKKESSLPDIIELEWTNFVYYAKNIRKRYPYIKIIASEHDVNFQSLQRKGVKSSKLKKLKKQEIDALKCCNRIVVQSEKDKNLLVKEGLSEKNILVISPYYHNMYNLNRKSNHRDILFWGAMYRSENYEAAIWFVKNVMPLLKDIDIRFVIAGNNPSPELKKYSNERVVITGFVENETQLFGESMCFVSPLLTGAGIKVKVLEALSAGIPVLTNSIGIEGISAVNNRDYFHCESPKQYADIIRKIYEGEIDEKLLAQNQKIFINNNFDLKKSLMIYEEMISEM